MKVPASGSHETRRWRGVDSNFQYAVAVNLIVALLCAAREAPHRGAHSSGRDDPAAGPPAAVSAVQSQPADRRQFQRRHRGVDADIQPQDVEFEPLIDGKQNTGQPEE
jgi:hypothetical protein